MHNVFFCVGGKCTDVLAFQKMKTKHSFLFILLGVSAIFYATLIYLIENQVLYQILDQVLHQVLDRQRNQLLENLCFPDWFSWWNEKCSRNTRNSVFLCIYQIMYI